MADVLAYLAGAALVLWGAAHIAPTNSVARSFGDISVDNKRILVMEWIAEGVTHISIGVLVVIITVAEGAANSAVELVYVLLAGILAVLATLTALTGARTRMIWFKACPFRADRLRGAPRYRRCTLSTRTS